MTERNAGGLDVDLGLRFRVETEPKIIRGHALDLLRDFHHKPNLIITDPPYAFGGSGDEHAISATVAIVLRESARRLSDGGWMIVFSASSWRSQAYMVEYLRGVLTPVRTGTWVKPQTRGKTRTPGWGWASVSAIAFRRGKSAAIPPSELPDWICCPPVMHGRRAEMPPEVCDWAVEPYCQAGGLAFDPFAGSGALVRSAHRFGMRSIGFELNPNDTTERARQLPLQLKGDD